MLEVAYTSLLIGVFILIGILSVYVVYKLYEGQS
ncbi:MAG: hypothetical protein JWN61_747 [Pseudonocardiales bacterium]|nr:hypothetical protein [Jatrophihabitantaceae bacterium]MCW2602612.1 hypothetical protein [Pseudonocardiales bacterium]